MIRATVHPSGRLLIAGLIFRAALGRGGVRIDKQEGDGATPAGVMKLRRVLYRADRLPPPACAVPVEPLAPDDGWCDNSANSKYNRPVQLPYDAHVEELWRQDHLYDVIGVLGWNDAPVRAGRGSAIFLHLARPDYAPTDGCVALRRQDLLQALARELTEIEVLT